MNEVSLRILLFQRMIDDVILAVSNCLLFLKVYFLLGNDQFLLLILKILLPFVFRRNGRCGRCRGGILPALRRRLRRQVLFFERLLACFLSAFFGLLFRLGGGLRRLLLILRGAHGIDLIS